MPNTDTTYTLAADDKTATALVATIKASVNGERKYVDYVAAHGVTRETIKVHAAALAAFTYPNEKPVQKQDGKRTKYGNAVQMIGAGLRRALGSDDDDSDPKPAVLRVSLSGEGGGSTVVEPTHPLYAALVEMLAADQD